MKQEKWKSEKEEYRSFRHKTPEERIQESGAELTGIGELDWGAPRGNEVW